MAGLYILVQQASPMKLAESHSDVGRQSQEAARLQGRAKQPLERLAAGILEHQHGPAALTNQLEWTHRPRPVQLLLQSIFVSKTIEGGRCGMLRSRQHGQHESRVVAMAISSAEDALTVLPENLEAAIPVGGKTRRRVQRGSSTGREPSYRCDAFEVRQT